MSQAADALERLLPLRIETAEYTDPTVLIGGRQWSMSITCAWRWVDANGEVVSAAQGDASDRIWDLAGEEITAVSWSGPSSLGLDPTFRLRGGGELTVLSDATFDTWVLHAQDLVLVGPLREA